MNEYQIPFNRASLVGNEMEYIQDAIHRGHVSGDGYYTLQCQHFLEETLGVAKVLLTTSCTHALELAALLLNIQPGDEVIIPSFTFVSTVNAFVLRGARPIFADICPDTLNLDETRLEALITSRTKAIAPVHYAGVGCAMDVILEIAQRHNLAVVEDNAHGLLGKYRQRYLGTFGNLATQSFHETKNFTCGEGGALLINQPELIERAEILREKGTDRSRFFRGQVAKYTWVDIGSSYLPSDILAAFLYAQFEHAQQIQAARQHIWETYQAGLATWARTHQVRQPMIPRNCEQTYHMYYLLLPTLDIRQRLIEHLKKHSILSVFHYLPLHLSKMGIQLGGKAGDCPVTEDISDRLLRLPFFYTLSASEQAYIISTIESFTG